jgi:MFS family permease
MKKAHFIGLLSLYVIVSFFLAATTPITPHEANNLYSNTGIVSLLMQWGSAVVPGFLGLRIFFLLFAFLSLRIFYELSQRYFSRREDVYLSTALFMFLPGILTATALANVGIIVLALVLFFVLMYERRHFSVLPLIMLALFFIHEASIIFFVALFFYGVTHKNKMLTIVSVAFVFAFVYLAKGIEIGGRPSGHFIEIFGLYAAVFSPLLFLYFFYTMYRILLREKKTLMWYISFTALAISLLLSIRQRVYITDFAPYVMISTIAMVDVFTHSLRVRLPQFQKRYLRAFYIVIVVLVFSAATIIFHRPFYYLAKDRKHHFAFRIYQPYDLAKALKQKGVTCYDAKGRTALQLRYYGIPSCRNF